jgi:hypothetical protein
MPVSDKLFDVDFGHPVSDEFRPQRGHSIIFPAVYLAAVALAEIGWLWLISWIVIYLTRLVLQ